MSINITNLGGTVNYHDNHKEFSIDARGRDLSEIMRAIDPEDVTPVVQEEPSKQNSTLPFLVLEKLAALGTYSEEEFDAMYHDAVKGGAPKLAKFIKHYRDLEVFNTKGYNKKETFEELKAYFGDELSFGYPNFAAYY